MAASVDNKPVVTVVMAVYNAAKTLPRAIESVLAQIFSNWRMICVNDGSTDNSLELLEEYAKKDTRIMVLSQRNQGPAAARATAYERLETPYAIMLDADDYYSPDLLEQCVNMAIKEEADIALPNMKIEQPNGSFMDWNKSYKLHTGMEMSGQEAFSRMFIQASVHGCGLWNASLLKRFALGQNATYNMMNADEYIQRLLFLNCKKVVFTGGIYYYACNQESITKKFSVRQLGYLDTCKKFIDFIEPYHLDGKLAAVIKEYYFRHIIHLQLRLYKDGKDLTPIDRNAMKQTLRKAYKEAMAFKKDFLFTEKRYPWLYKLFSTNGYVLFCLSVFTFAMYQKYKGA